MTATFRHHNPQPLATPTNSSNINTINTNNTNNNNYNKK
jgi:hypothetical protein